MGSSTPATVTTSNLSVALTSYLGVSGTDLYRRDGVLYANSRVRLGDITDGTSQTLLVGERPPSADLAYGWCRAHRQFVKLYHPASEFWSQCQFKALARERVESETD